MSRTVRNPIFAARFLALSLQFSSRGEIIRALLIAVSPVCVTSALASAESLGPEARAARRYDRTGGTTAPYTAALRVILIVPERPRRHVRLWVSAVSACFHTQNRNGCTSSLLKLSCFGQGGPRALEPRRTDPVRAARSQAGTSRIVKPDGGALAPAEHTSPLALQDAQEPSYSTPAQEPL